RIEQVDVDDRDAGLGVALDVVERRRLLELLLDALGHLLHRLQRRGARPARLHDHGHDRELRILLAAQLEAGKDAGRQDKDHRIDGQDLVPQRPLRKIEAGHLPRSAGRRTFWPSASELTPAVTTMSPFFRPSAISTESVSKRITLTGRFCTW